MNRILLNFLLFQIGWFACVLGAAANQPEIGAGIACVILIVHIICAYDKQKELLLIAIAMLIGIAWDSLLVWQDLLGYSSGILAANTAPYWIVILWGLFATTLNVSLRWLRQRVLLSALFGAIAGPLAYYAGQKLGAVQFLDTPLALLFLGIGWAIFTPLLISLSMQFDGFRPTRMRSAL